MLRASLAGVERHRHVGDVRQAGLMVGVELVADRASKATFRVAERHGHQVCLALRPRGIYARPLGDVIVLMPPLTSTDEELRALGAALEAALVERFGA